MKRRLFLLGTTALATTPGLMAGKPPAAASLTRPADVAVYTVSDLWSAEVSDGSNWNPIPVMVDKDGALSLVVPLDGANKFIQLVPKRGYTPTSSETFTLNLSRV